MGAKRASNAHKVSGLLNLCRGAYEGVFSISSLVQFVICVKNCIGTAPRQCESSKSILINFRSGKILHWEKSQKIPIAYPVCSSQYFFESGLV